MKIEPSSENQKSEKLFKHTQITKKFYFYSLKLTRKLILIFFLERSNYISITFFRLQISDFVLF